MLCVIALLVQLDEEALLTKFLFFFLELLDEKDNCLVLKCSFTLFLKIRLNFF